MNLRHTSSNYPKKAHLNIRTLAVRAVLEDQLLQVEKRSLVVHPLSDLHNRRPSVVRERGGTVVTLLIPHDESDHHRLLEHCTIANLFLHREFQLETPTVGLCPYPRRVNQLDLFKAHYLVARRVTSRARACYFVDLARNRGGRITWVSSTRL